MKRKLLNTLALGIAITSMAQPGSLDPTFADNAEIKYINFLEPESEATTHVLVDPLDRIWIGGYTLIDGDFKFIIVRLTPDGEYDPDFYDDGFVVSSLNDNNIEVVQGMIWQNGKILIAGYQTINSRSTSFVIRLSSAGIADLSFGESGIANLPFNSKLSDMTIDDDDNIYLSGHINGNITVTKLTPDGIPDQSFSNDGFHTLISATTDESVSLAVKDNGEIFIFGSTTLVGTTSGLIHCLSPNGADNTDWSESGRIAYTWPSNTDFIVTDAIMSEAQSCFYLAGKTENNQLNAAAISVGFDGNLKLSFGDNGRLTFDATLGLDEIFTSVVESSQGLYFGINIAEQPDGIDAAVVHFNHLGEIITSFGNQGLANYNIHEGGSDQALDLAFQSDGNLILLGIASINLTSFAGYAVRIITEDETSDLANLDFKLAKIYPNPAFSTIQIELDDLALQGETVQIYNITGQLVYSDMLMNSNQSIEISLLTPGQYQLIIGERTFGRFTKLK